MSCTKVTTPPKGTDYRKDFLGSFLSNKIFYASIQPYIHAYENTTEIDIVGICTYVMISLYFQK